ncbi:asparaginase [Sneathiella limimaris]|uniref:asparaginase n=1 Tax=Sneathiella limimaris TaxID=1964213 RepID=UPI00146F83D8|nr:asparaginase [Sneathiella limimaris]
MLKQNPKNTNSEPITVEVWRGKMVESLHHVNAVVTDSDGAILHSWGNVESPVYLRSAIKPVQALPLVETGAADAFSVSEQELSLACASHTGEDIHVSAVTKWLERLGLSIEELECGAHWPTYPPAERALAAKGLMPTTAHNNCSGKHTGFLATALHLGEDHKGYIRLDHPVQQRIVKVLEEFTGLDLEKAEVGIDGCSIPTIAIPLLNSAMAIARFADPNRFSGDRVAACKRIQSAIAKAPEMIAGSDRLCTALNRSAKGSVIAKVGAEGVYLAALPDQGLGIALKTLDGTKRGAEVALGGILELLGVMSEDMRRETADFTAPVITNWNKMNVGHMSVIDN